MKPRKDGKKRWTKEEENYLVQAIENKENVATLEQKFGVSYMAIKRKYQEMGLTRNIYDDGLYYSTKETGDILGLEVSTIRKYIKKNYIRTRTITSGKKNFHTFSPRMIVTFMYNHVDKWIEKDFDKDMLSLLFLEVSRISVCIPQVKFLKGLLQDKYNYKWNKAFKSMPDYVPNYEEFKMALS